MEKVFPYKGEGEVGSSAKLGSSAKTARNQGGFGEIVNQSCFKRVEKYKNGIE